MLSLISHWRLVERTFINHLIDYSYIDLFLVILGLQLFEGFDADIQSCFESDCKTRKHDATNKLEEYVDENVVVEEEIEE